MAIDVNAVLQAGRCYGCTDPLIRRRLFGAILCQIVRVDDPSFQCGNNLFATGCVSCLPIERLWFLQTKLLCLLAQIGTPGLDCTPAALVADEPCVACGDPAVVQTLITTLASQALAGLDAAADLDPSAILGQAPCIACLSGQPLEVAITQLLVAWLTQTQPPDVPALVDDCSCLATAVMNPPLIQQAVLISQMVTPPPVGCSDEEVDGWVTRAAANTGNVSAATAEAACQFMTAIKAVSGLRAKIKRLNLFAGDDYTHGIGMFNFGAVQVPLIKDVGSLLDESLNSDTANSTYAENVGIRFNTGTGFNTNIDASVSFTVNDFHYGIYSLEANAQVTNGTGGISAPDPANHAAFMRINAAGTTLGVIGSFASANNYASGVDVSGKGLYLMTRASAANVQLYREGVIFATSVNTAGALPTAPTGSLVIMYLQNQGVPQDLMIKTVGGYTIGTGLTAADQLALYNAFRAFQVALGRNPL